MKRLVYVAVVALIAISCGKKNNTLLGPDNEFKVKDTASVDKIFLASKSNQTVTLTRDGNKWMANGEFEARTDLVANLLHTIRNVEVKQYVPKNAIDNALKVMSVSATKVEIYVKGKLNKVYYVGGPTQDHFGTYMLMQGSDVPYICYLPGFRGYLSNHYIPVLEEWKSRQVFAYHIDNIASVKTEFYNDPASSWEITNVDNNNFKLKSLATNQYLDYDTGAVKTVLRQFKALGFESYATVDKARMDSVKLKYRLYKISLKEKTGTVRSLDLYALPMAPGTYTMDGREAKVDIDKMYGIVDDKIVTICQYFTYDPVAVPIGYFAPAGTKPPSNR